MRRALTLVTACCVVAGAVAVLSSRSPDLPTADSPRSDSPQCVASDSACIRSAIERDALDGRFAEALHTLLTVESKNGCHAWGHMVGKIAANRLAADALTMNSDELDVACDFGYLHGAFQGLVAAGTDVRSVIDLGCPVNRDAWWLNECFHGVGHALASSGVSIEQALLDCRALDREEPACASGVYMEFAARYLEQGSQQGMNPDEHSPAQKLTDDAAASMCFALPKTDAPGLLDSCARKAALFWGPNHVRGALGSRCAELLLAWSGGHGEGTAVECGAGIGEWFRNSMMWDAPTEPDEAAKLNEVVASACTEEVRGLVGEISTDVLYGCIEGAVLATLPGQVSAGLGRDSWLNPCELRPLLRVRDRCIELIERVERQAVAGVAS
jgi:hypothetical protein